MRFLFFCANTDIHGSEDQEPLNYLETGCTEKLVASRYQGYPGNPGTPRNSEDSETEGRIWPYHYQKSPDCAPHTHKVFSILRETHGRSPTDDLSDLDVNNAFGWEFMSVTLQAAVHIAHDVYPSFSLVCEGPLSSRTLLVLISDRISVPRPNSFLGSHREWNQPIRDRNVSRNFH